MLTAAAASWRSLGCLRLHLLCLLLPRPLWLWRRRIALLPTSSSTSFTTPSTCKSLLPTTLMRRRDYHPARASMTPFHLPAFKCRLFDPIMHPIIGLSPVPVTLACWRCLGWLRLHLLCLLLPGPLWQRRRRLALLPTSSSTSSTASSTCKSLLPITLMRCRVYHPARASMTPFHLPAFKCRLFDPIMHPIIKLSPVPDTLA